MDDQQSEPAQINTSQEQDNQPSWQFNPEDATVTTQSPGGDTVRRPVIESVEWTASEYIAHHKTPGWFVVLGIVTAVATIIVYLITGGDKMSAAMIIVVGLFFGIAGARPPRVLSYAVNESGIRIDKKFYSFSDFKSFAILDEGGISSIMLIPLKRWMPPLTVYYAPEDEQKIIAVLSAVLPGEQREQDALDRLMRRVRF